MASRAHAAGEEQLAPVQVARHLRRPRPRQRARHRSRAGSRGSSARRPTMDALVDRTRAVHRSGLGVRDGVRGTTLHRQQGGRHRVAVRHRRSRGRTQRAGHAALPPRHARRGPRRPRRRGAPGPHRTRPRARQRRYRFRQLLRVRPAALGGLRPAPAVAVRSQSGPAHARAGKPASVLRRPRRGQRPLAARRNRRRGTARGDRQTRHERLPQWLVNGLGARASAGSARRHEPRQSATAPDRSPARARDQPRQGLLARRRSHQGRPARLLPGHRRRTGPPSARPPGAPQPFP